MQNLSPSLACEAPLDLKIKSHLVADMLSLGLVQAKDPVKAHDRQRVHVRHIRSVWLFSLQLFSWQEHRRPMSSPRSINFTAEDRSAVRFGFVIEVA